MNFIPPLRIAVSALLLGLLLAACNTAPLAGDPTTPYEGPRFGDSDLDNAPMFDLGDAPFEVALNVPADLSDVLDASNPVPAAQAAALAAQQWNVPIDGRSNYAYPYSFEGSNGPIYRIRVKSTAAGDDNFFTRYLLYDGSYAIDSVAVSANGDRIVFSAESDNGSMDLYLFDFTGRLTGTPESISRLTDTAVDEVEVHISLNGQVVAWLDTSDDPSYEPRGRVTSFDRSIRLIFTGAPSISDVTISGNGRVAAMILGNQVLFRYNIFRNRGSFPYRGELTDVSFNNNAMLGLITEVVGGSTVATLVDFASRTSLGAQLTDTAATDIAITGDGRYFAYAEGGAVYASLLNPADPASALVSTVSDVAGQTAYGPSWAKYRAR